MKKLVFFCWYCAYFTAAWALHADSAVTNVGCVTNPPDLNALTYEDASEAVNNEWFDIMQMKIKTISPEYMSNLVKMLRLGNLDNDRKVLGIYLLGRLQPKDTNSIAFLIEIIDFKASRIDLPTTFPRWGRYPAQEALISIGRPTIDAIFQALQDEEMQLRRLLMCEALVSILGKTDPAFNKAEGVRAVQRQIGAKLAIEANPKRKANLELALKELEK
jgi:hypothetical protein